MLTILRHILYPAELRGLPALLVLAGPILLSGCERLSGPGAHAAPSAEEVRKTFTWERAFSLTMSGNVAQVTVEVDPEPFRRGGDLWAKATPYLFLFSDPTREAFEAHPGLGGVRVITQHPNGDWMARALLSREVLNEYSWRQALSVAGQARRDGTESPARMGDLVRWGEDHTEFEYNPDYITGR